MGTSEPISFATSAMIARVFSSSCFVIASGIMISGRTSTPFFFTDAAASRIARACIRVNLGERDREAHAAMPEHRVELEELLRARFDLRRRDAESLRHAPPLFRLVRQKFMERRIEQRMVTGRPSIAVKICFEIHPLEGEELRERLLAIGLVSARIISRTASMRSSSKNMCSVRHRPMPSAPKFRAVFASSSVSRVRAHLDRARLVRASHLQEGDVITD